MFLRHLSFLVEKTKPIAARHRKRRLAVWRGLIVFEIDRFDASMDVPATADPAALWRNIDCDMKHLMQ